MRSSMSKSQPTVTFRKQAAGGSTEKIKVQTGPSQKVLLDKLRQFQKSDDENRKCADCGELGPTYICMNYGTFVCTACSGIHREFNHKVKGLSVSEWKQEEVDFILDNGNKKSNAKYLARWRGEMSMPDSALPDKVRLWIRTKYEDLRWVAKEGGDSSTSPKPSRNRHVRRTSNSSDGSDVHGRKRREEPRGSESHRSSHQKSRDKTKLNFGVDSDASSSPPSDDRRSSRKKGREGKKKKDKEKSKDKDKKRRETTGGSSAIATDLLDLDDNCFGSTANAPPATAPAASATIGVSGAKTTDPFFSLGGLSSAQPSVISSQPHDPMTSFFDVPTSSVPVIPTGWPPASSAIGNFATTGGAFSLGTVEREFSLGSEEWADFAGVPAGGLVSTTTTQQRFPGDPFVDIHAANTPWMTSTSPGMTVGRPTQLGPPSDLSFATHPQQEDFLSRQMDELQQGLMSQAPLAASKTSASSTSPPPPTLPKMTSWTSTGNVGQLMPDSTSAGSSKPETSGMDHQLDDLVSGIAQRLSLSTPAPVVRTPAVPQLNTNGSASSSPDPASNHSGGWADFTSFPAPAPASVSHSGLGPPARMGSLGLGQFGAASTQRPAVSMDNKFASGWESASVVAPPPSTGWGFDAFSAGAKEGSGSGVGWGSGTENQNAGVKQQSVNPFDMFE